jgi:metallophosphoesterase (TIGR00282 family)
VRVLFIGDIFSTPGMKVVQAYLERARDDYDFIIANGENAAGGFGITRRHFQQLRDAGVDVVTLGNHGWDQGEAIELAEETPRLVRAANYPPGTPGVGAATFEARGGERITVAQAMGRVFMDALDDPFRAVDGVVEDVPEGQALLLDFHAEATSEKKVMLYHLAGRASAVIGTHTHVQTADETIVRGTAYITDVGMSGVQASSIGMGFEEVHARFVHKLPRRYRPAQGRGTLCGVVLEFVGGRARAIRRLQWPAPTEDLEDEPRAGR